MIETKKFVRKPLYVDAVRVTAGNFEEIAAWCQGEILQSEGSGSRKKHIKVRVHNPKIPRQTQAFIGDWILYTERGYKVYTNKAFNASFDEALPPTQLPIDDSPQHAAAVQEIKDREGVVTPPVPIENVEIQSISAVAEEPSPETGVGPIHSVEEEDKAVVDEPRFKTTSPVPEHHNPEIYRSTEQPQMSPEMDQAIRAIEAEGGEVVEATSQAIAETVRENEQERVAIEAAGKRVLSHEEQAQMTQDEIRDLLTTGEVILVQDLAA